MYVTRFAPSPTGPLHLGHAYSAAIGFLRARKKAGQFLLRIEDIDQSRSRDHWENQIYDDLSWIGLTWQPNVMRQSKRMPEYQKAIRKLGKLGLLYPCSCTRGDIKQALAAPQEGTPKNGPDGLIYPGICRHRSISDARSNDAIRLNIKQAVQYLDKGKELKKVAFSETGPIYDGLYSLADIDFTTQVGDFVIARRDMGTSYHLSVVVDDHASGVTEVVRGADLWEATPIHRLLYALLDIPAPAWHHHDLIRDTEGKRLAKRDDARSIKSFRDAGDTPEQVLAHVGLDGVL
ncbi:MAG: tRNA glutamyl-Q(34) synthetase GluQRS [Dinoroseobacter sp.]|nr:tRNA glutamyl-Q(34) synthetase GluQRS [Dinoroseobacter sp.]